MAYELLNQASMRYQMIHVALYCSPAQIPPKYTGHIKLPFTILPANVCANLCTIKSGMGTFILCMVVSWD